jgi:hypothetical protein
MTRLVQDGSYRLLQDGVSYRLLQDGIGPTIIAPGTFELSAIRAALATTAKGSTNLRPYSYLALQPQPPALVVGWPDNFDPRVIEASAAATLTIPVVIVVSLREDRAADVEMMGYLDVVPRNIAADATLGGLVDSAAVTSVERVVQQDLGGNIPILVGTISVEVYT